MRRSAMLHIFNNTPSLGIILFVLVLFTGCLQDTEEFITIKENIEVTAFGVVLNENNLPVEMTNVVIGGESTFTDSNGVFIFDNVVVPSDVANLTFQRAGYFDAYKAFVPGQDIPSFTVRMLKKGNPYDVSPAGGANINATDEVGLSIAANALQDLGTPYNGQAQVFTSYLNPLNENLYMQLPGEPLALNTLDERSLLFHYGTVFVQIRGDMDQALNVASDKPMTLRIPLPSSLGMSAPQEMDFWKLDPMTNQWKLQGQALLQGDHYEAQITEEGIYSIQESTEYITLSGSIVEGNGNEVANTLVALSSSSIGITQKTWTSGSGQFKIFAPLRSDLTLEIEDECYDEIKTLELGPYLSSTDLGDVEIDIDADYWDFTGQLLKCGLTEGVSVGYSLIKTDKHQWIIPVDQGFFQLSIFLCGNSFQVKGIDLETGLSTIEQDLTVNNRDRNFSLGVLSACE